MPDSGAAQSGASPDRRYGVRDPHANTPPPDPETLQAGYRYGLALTHRHHDAEDLVQEAWLKLVRRYGRVKNRTMLYTTIRNLFYDQRRRGKLIRFEPLEEGQEPAAPQTGSRKGDLDTLLGGLRAEEREALFLHAVEGWTAREIARKTRRPRNTVLSLIHRARKKLSQAAAGEARVAAGPDERNRSESP